MHQLLRLAEHVTRWFNKKPAGRTISIFIDAEKAFDTVWHDGLRVMFLEDDFPVTLIRWLSSWLSQRKCRVRVNEALSVLVLLPAGVAQGSLVSPTLYVYFIRKMPTKTSDELISSFYADDTSYAGSDNPHASRNHFAGESLQQILLELEQFCSKWRIGLNAAKTKCLIFKNSRKNNQNPPNLYLRKEVLQFETEVKFLGVLFDKKLTYENHILDLTKKCKQCLNLLRSMCGNGWGASSETILYTYRTFIRPLLDYGAVLYAHADDSLLAKIQAIETTAIKIAELLVL